MIELSMTRAPSPNLALLNYTYVVENGRYGTAGIAASYSYADIDCAIHLDVYR